MPTSSSVLLKRLLVRSGVLPAAEALFWTRNRCRAAKIVGYHRILENGFFHSSPLPGETLVRRFDEQMRYFSKHFRILPLSEIANRVIEQTPLPERCMALTFDDGYRDLLTVGHPALTKYGLPATCFLPTHHTETNRLFTFDAIAFAFLQTRIPFAAMVPDGRDPLPLQTPGQRRHAMHWADRHFKSLPPDQGGPFLEGLFSRLEVTVPETYPPENGLLTWDDVRELSRAGVEFQAHSVSHATFSGLTGDEIRQEAADAKEEIEQRTEIPVTLFCFPGGRREDCNAEARSILKGCGYRGAVVGVRGSFRVTDDLFAMKRYMVDSDLGTEEVAGRISELFNGLQGLL